MTAFVFDLDGVLYRGERAVEGAGRTLGELSEAGQAILFATNNSFRSVPDVAAKIRRLTGYRARPEQIATSAVAAARLAIELSIARPLVIGGPGIFEALRSADVTATADEKDADGVIVGLDYDFSYRRLEQAMTVVQRGLPFVATNLDATFPADGHLRPGAGSIVAAVEAAGGASPTTAGKPEQPMIDLLDTMIASTEVVMVGDRPETDLALGKRAGWHTVGVASGVTATVEEIPSHLRPDVFLSSVATLPETARQRGWLGLVAEGEAEPS